MRAPSPRGVAEVRPRRNFQAVALPFASVIRSALLGPHRQPYDVGYRRTDRFDREHALYPNKTVAIRVAASGGFAGILTCRPEDT
jgi:hypothetical protein